MPDRVDNCGSGKHWDPECKYSRKGERKARTNLSVTNSEDIEAQNNYNELYYGLQSEDEYESAQEDFPNPLQQTPESSRFANVEREQIDKHAELIQVLVEAQSPRSIPLSATAKSKVDISYNPSLGLINVEVRASSLGNAALRMVVEQTPEHANTAREWIHGRRDSKCARYVDNPSGAPCIASDKGA